MEHSKGRVVLHSNEYPERDTASQIRTFLDSVLGDVWTATV